MMNNYNKEIIDFYDQMKRDKVNFYELDLDRDDYLAFSKINGEPFIGKNIKYRDLEDMFFSSINCFYIRTIRFYLEGIREITIYRDPYLSHGFAYLEGDSILQKIIIPDGQLKEIDFISYAHELGHLPTLIHPVKDDAFEYLEVLPMFIEYSAFLECDKDNGYTNFINNLKWMVSEISKSYLECDNCNNMTYSFLQKKDHQKYLYSFDYCLQLIERFFSDKDIVYKNINQYVLGGKSMKMIAKDLDIDTRECKVLKKIL